MKTDLEIQKNVMEELQWDPRLEAAHIGVAVKDGVVTLSGQVNTYAKKIAAEEAAKSIKGVKAVAEEIEITLLPHNRRTDTEIAETAVRSLKYSTSIPEDMVKVIVEDAWVTLEGQIEWSFQRDEAKRAIEHNKGVRGVTNLITIKPRINTPVIKEAIKKALERSADIEADSIVVETADNKVILRGTVKSWHEMHDVWQAAWNAPGVAQVENKLTIR